MEDFRIPKQNMFTRGPHYGRFRLNHPFMPDNVASDCLDSTDGFITILLGYIPYKITRLAKQCRRNFDNCVTRFSVSFSLHDGEWFDYQEDGETKVCL